MNVSIITTTLNSEATVGDCLASVRRQSVPVEQIVVDGASRDRTVEIARAVSPDARILSEPDRGIYDAMNKGIRMASGEIVGILNSDDFYSDGNAVEKVARLFSDPSVGAVFADLVYVRPHDLNRVVRYYRGKGFTPERFAWGCMPPHPTFFARRELYERYGLFRTDYRIAADFELTARFLYRHRVRYAYLPEVIVTMRTGGASTKSLHSNLVLNREILRACAESGIRTNLFKVYAKYFRKVGQLIERPA